MGKRAKRTFSVDHFQGNLQRYDHVVDISWDVPTRFLQDHQDNINKHLAAAFCSRPHLSRSNFTANHQLKTGILHFYSPQKSSKEAALLKEDVLTLNTWRSSPI